MAQRRRLDMPGQMLTVRVHPRGRAELDRLAALAGVDRSAILRRALTIGVREIRRDMSLHEDEVELFGEWPGTELEGLG